MKSDFTMARFIFLFVFVAILDFILSDPTSYVQEPSSDDEADAFASSSAYSETSSFAVASSYAKTTSSSKSTSTSTAESCATSGDNTIKCGKNQIYDVCPSSCPPRTCDTKDVAFDCVEPLKPGDPKCPRPKCRCADNYYSNDQGECVPKDQCPTKSCGLNEIYLSCPAPLCGDQICENIGKKFPCPFIPKRACKGECRCKPGYYKNKIGECISEEDCKKCTGDYEYFSCGSACDNECDKLSTQNRTNCPIVNIKCNPKCYCLDGYARDANNKCIPISKCPRKKICGINEIYKSCPKPTCAKQTCENIDKKFHCPLIPAKYPCIGECQCKPGYYKNQIDQCISKRNCKKCGENQVYDLCPSSCPPRTCDTKDIAFKCKAPLKPGDPNCPDPKCRCADNYYRNDKNECVLKEECPTKNCGTNEVYLSCPVPLCANQTCENIGKKFGCPLIPSDYPCKGECRCKPGYYRNKIGQCISEEECKQCTGEYEYFSCDSACDNECDKLSTQNRTNCPIVNIQCNKMCYCLDGYARDANKKCIPISQCPQPQCGCNEVVSDCANSPCIRNCATKDLKLACRPYPPGCKTGCVCKDGYFRDSNGVCVPADKCPPKIPECNENEEFSDCPNKECRAKKCSELGFPLACNQIPPEKTDCGKPACICKSGFVRNEDGVCVDSRDCPSCGGDSNAWSGCGTFCTRCNNYKDKARGCPASCMENGCDCRPNYVYDSEESKKCVLPEKCPNKNCDINEVYYSCPKPTYFNQTCENIGKVYYCPFIPADYPCKGECRCKPGYYKNQIGQCITEENCKKCGKNQVYDLCPSSCPSRTCDNKDIAFKCKAPLKPGDPNCPAPKCRCADNYYRNDQNECVLKDECTTKNCGTNEVYLSCPAPLCANQTCENIGKKFSCPAFSSDYPCKGECRCKPGYFRNKIGQCISEEECKQCTGEYEFFSCGSECDNECDKLSTQNRTNCPILNIQCNKMCYCLDGYARDANKKCIPISQCPQPQCGCNEVVSDCANSPCIRNCATKDLNLACRPYPPGCKTGCVCKDGYYRDSNDVCVPADKCPPNIPECDQNEEFSDCPNKECKVKKCSELGFPLACDQVPWNNTDCGKPACICKSGFVRNDDGVCVNIRDCPSCGGDKNAWSGCGTFCTNCENYKEKGKVCPASCWDNGCDCRPNYVYNRQIGKCVLPEECPVCDE